MLTELESRRHLGFAPKNFIVDLNVKNNAFAFLGRDAIYVDPSFHPTILTTAGEIPATTRRIIAHELGHAVFGTADDGPDRMNNVLQNDNPIMNSLGEPSGLRY